MYMFSVLITDGTERSWVQVIAEVGEAMLGKYNTNIRN